MIVTRAKHVSFGYRVLLGGLLCRCLGRYDNGAIRVRLEADAPPVRGPGREVWAEGLKKGDEFVVPAERAVGVEASIATYRNGSERLYLESLV